MKLFIPLAAELVEFSITVFKVSGEIDVRELKKLPKDAMYNSVQSTTAALPLRLLMW